ncbi:MAG TPA: hypothetical protein VFG84_01615 [Gemmatimonadaceae bacterium]|nr:hypothetical protein [Gemmatimonadaceae bacterium]
MPRARDLTVPGGRTRWIAAAIVFVIVILAISPLPVGIWVDDGHYVILGKALASGEGLRYINLPGAPSGVHFPPGYPAVLAVLWLFAPEFPANVAVFQFANAVFTAIAAFCLVRLGERELQLSGRVALITAVVWGLSIPTLMLATAVMSEALWWAILLPALAASERAARHGRDRDAVLAGVLLAAAMLVRSISITAVVASIVVLAWRRRWRALAQLGGIVGVGVAPWLLWKSAHTVALPATVQGMYGGYGTWLSDGYATQGMALLRSTLAANTLGVFRALTAYWSVVPNVVGWILAVVLFGLAMAGAWAVRHRATILVVTLVSYLGILLVWPFAPDRFICGAAVLWIPLVAVGGQELWRLARRAPAWPRFFVALPPAAAAAAIVIATALAVPTRGWAVVPGRDPANAMPIAEWTVRNTARDALLVADAETFVYLYTQRQAVPPVPYTALDVSGTTVSESNRAGLVETLAFYKPDWVLAMTAPSVRAAEQLATDAHPALTRVAVLRVGAAYAVNAQAPVGR